MNSKLSEELSENNREIADLEAKIEVLENEIKELKKQGNSTYSQVLEKKIKIAELEKEIIEITGINNRKAGAEISNDLAERTKTATINKDEPARKKYEKEYIEYFNLKRCYQNKNTLDYFENEKHLLELKSKLVQITVPYKPDAYRQLQEMIKTAEMSAELYRDGLEKSVASYAKQGGKQGTKINFNKPYTEILKEYEENFGTIEKQAVGSPQNGGKEEIER